MIAVRLRAIGENRPRHPEIRKARPRIGVLTRRGKRSTVDQFKRIRKCLHGCC